MCGKHDTRGNTHPYDTGHKSKSTELLGSSPALQDGRYPYVAGYSSARRMACQTGSEGRLLHSTNPSGSLEVPSLRGGPGSLPIHMSTIRSILCSLGFYQSAKASRCLPKKRRGSPYRLYIAISYSDRENAGRSSESHGCLDRSILEGLGFIVNMEKSVLTPSQQIEFLGLLLNTTSMCLTLPGHKIRTIRKEAALLLRQGNFSARKLAQFIGKLNAASQAVFPAPLFYRHLQRDLQGALARGSQNYDTSLQLSRASREEVQWWQEHLTLYGMVEPC